jgi:ABC-type uncharacterized transport system ATPase subunit
LLLDEPIARIGPRERAETVQSLKNIRRRRTIVVVAQAMRDQPGLFDRHLGV